MKSKTYIQSLAFALVITTWGAGSVLHEGQNAPVLSTNTNPVTAVLGAFDREIYMLEDQLEDSNDSRIEGLRFVTGTMAGRKTVIAWTGIGKVNAAMTTTLLLEHYRPAEVIFTGIAGGINPDFLPGDIVIAERTAHHDMGTVWPEGFFPRGVKNPLSGWQNPVFFEADERLFNLAKKAGELTDFKALRTGSDQREPLVMSGTIVTGDLFVASKAKGEELRKKFEADAVEMEGAAVAQICYQRRIPCLVIRSMSDTADEGAREDSMMFHMMAAHNSAALVSDIVALIQKDAVTKQGEKGDRK